MKSKKILGLLLVVTLLSATVFGTASVFAAGAETNVKLESYMPPVKTIFVDDDFENRGDVGTSLKGNLATDTYGTAGIEGVVAGDATNKYVTVTDAWKSVMPKTDKYVSIRNAQKLVIAVENKHSDTNSNSAKFAIQLNETTAILFEASSPSGYNKNELYNVKLGTSLIATNIGLDNTTWNKIYIVMERDGDVAKVTKILIDGTDKSYDGKITIPLPQTLPSTWWGNDTKVPVRLNTRAANNSFDNVLIYEPYDVYMTDLNIESRTAKIVNDGSNAVTGNVFIALYDNDKNLLAAKEASTDLSVPAGGSQTVSLDKAFGHDNAKTAKIFFWNKSSLAPLCAAETVPLS